MTNEQEKQLKQLRRQLIDEYHAHQRLPIPPYDSRHGLEMRQNIDDLRTAIQAIGRILDR